MSISLADLKAAVRGGYAGNRFALLLSRLQSTAIDALALDSFPGGVLTVADPQPAEESDDSITVRGQGIDVPFAGMAVAVRFFLAGGDAVFHLVATGGPDWSLANSFPLLTGTVTSGFAWADSAPPQLQLLCVPDADLPVGLSLDGSLDLNKCIGGLAGLLGRQVQPLTGALEVKEGGASLRAVQIDAPVSEHVDLKIAAVDKLTFKVGSNLYYDFIERRFVAVPFVGLSAHLPFQAQGKNYAIPVSVEIADLGRDFRFQADVTDAIDAGLHELSSLTQGVGLGELVPKDFHLEDVLRINELSFDFNPTATNKLTAVSVGVESTKCWKIFHLDASNKDLTVEDVKFSLVVSDPLGEKSPGKNNVFAALRGELALGSASRLVLAAQYPDFLVQGNLKEGTTLHLGELFADFLGPAAEAEVPALEILTLSFSLGGGEYALDAEVDGFWAIGPVSLLSVQLALAHNTTGTQADFAGLFTIAGVTLLVSADYAGTGQGWTFKGELSTADNGIKLAQIVSDIVQFFGVAQPLDAPEFLAAWMVQKVALQFNTASKKFDFVLDIANSDAPGLSLDFGLHVKGAETVEFDGKALYEHKAPDFALEVDLTIKEVTQAEKPLKVVTVLGEYKTVENKPPTLADLLEAISQELKIDANLPGELNINAEADEIAVFVKQSDTDPVIFEAAGEFSIAFSGSTLDAYFAYTNDVTSDPALAMRISVNDKPAYVFGATVGGVLDLSKLPVVGKIPGISQLAIDKLGFFYTNAPLGQEQKAYFQVPQVSGPRQLAADPAQSVVTRRGFNLVAIFGKQGDTSGSPISAQGTMNIPVNSGAPPPQQPPGFAGQPAQPASPIHWIDVGKTFGPVTLRQVGLNYSNGEATIGFSAGMNMAGFMLDLQGLSVTFPMPLPKHAAGSTISFGLEGLALSINKGGLQLGGAFLKAVDSDTTVSYYGEVIVQAAGFGFTALGGYSPNANPASFFIYANIEVPLGGPPFLFITGLAGGFGINRDLKLPTVDNLRGCPLIPGDPKTPVQGSSPADTIKSVLPVLQGLFPYEAGEYCVAAGIRFTSFEMIQAFTLLTVDFGVDLQIGLIGTCRMSYPAGENEVLIAYAEMDIVADFTASTGALAVDGRLSPASYIFGGFVHLSGGFAFYAWFGEAHKGNFVVSLGGYHPAFVKPDYYPAVPRLSINFGLGPFQVIGQAYFALTPGMMMAGIGFSATWDSGSLKVWFDLGVDFLIGWAPFHYEGHAYVHMGISLDVGLFTIHLHVGADLFVWGPEFGGTAHVDLDVVSFTIHFGADRQAPAPVGWDTFKSKFLPANTDPGKVAALRFGSGPAPAVVNIVKADVTEGLLDKNTAGYDWIVDPEHFVIQTNSTIPSNYAAWNPAKPPVQPSDANLPNTLSSYRPAPPLEQPNLTYPAPLPVYAADQNLLWNPNLHIKPMGLEGINSFHTISLSLDGQPVPEVTLQPVLLDSNQALWGRPGQNTDPNDQALAKCMLSGFLITPIRRIPDAVSNVPLIDLLFQFGYNTNFTYTAQALDTRFTVRSSVDGDALNITVSGAADENLPNPGGILSALTNDWVSRRRAAVLDDLLAHNGFSTFSAKEIDLHLLASQTALTHWPVVELMGA